MIDFFTRGDLFQLKPDKGLRAVIRIEPGDDGCDIPDDVPVVEMALDRWRVRQRKRSQDQTRCLDRRRIHDVRTYSAILSAARTRVIISGTSDTRRLSGHSG